MSTTTNWKEIKRTSTKNDSVRTNPVKSRMLLFHPGARRSYLQACGLAQSAAWHSRTDRNLGTADFHPASVSEIIKHKIKKKIGKESGETGTIYSEPSLRANPLGLTPCIQIKAICKTEP